MARKRSSEALKLDSSVSEDKGRALTSVMGPSDLDTPEKRAKYAGDLTDEVEALVQAERKKQGLPPLT